MTFDTFAYTKRLKKSGISDEHAEAMVDGLIEALKSKDVATKQDVEKEIEALKSETIKWMAGMLLTQTGLITAIMIAVMKMFSS